MPSQQAPMPNTSLAFPNQPSNQSAQLNSSTNVVPFQKRESKGSKLISFGATAHLPNQSQSTVWWNFSNPAPLIQAPQIAQQSSNFTSGNPGSSRSALNKGKSINFSKNSGNWPLSSIKGSSSHYGGAIPLQQAPMPGTLFPAFSNQSAQLNASTNYVPSPTGTHSTIFFGGNSQNNEGMFNTRKPSSEKKGKKPRN
ncbi:hypothetical protein GPALN_005892 [Globodera pallida]|nr:hypothetical protein GPALN_005892 [Globodera pallida]